jgi:hypothetical protein
LSKIEVDTVEPQSGTSLTLGASGDTITIPAGATFDSSAATTTLPATVVTTTGTQTLSNKTIDATQLTDSTVTLAKLSATGTQDATTFLRGDNTFATPAGGTNTPAFSANNLTSTVTGTISTAVKAVFDNELFDTAGAYDAPNSKFTVPIGQGGKYHFSASLNSFESTANNTSTGWQIYLYKNGANELFLTQGGGSHTGNARMNMITTVLDLSAGDYIEVYFRYNASSGNASYDVGHDYNRFSGFKIIE